MDKQNQAAEAKSDKRNQPKVKPTVVGQFSDDLVGLAQLPGDSIQTQLAWLGDTRLQTAQRQALATQIGRVQGNRHLRRVVASLRRDHKPPLNELGTDVGQQTLIEKAVPHEVEVMGDAKRTGLLTPELLQGRGQVGDKGADYERTGVTWLRERQLVSALQHVWVNQSVQRSKVIEAKPSSEPMTPAVQREVGEADKADDVSETKEPTIRPKSRVAFTVPVASTHDDVVALLASVGKPGPKGTLAYGYTAWRASEVTTFPRAEIDWTKSGKKWTGEVRSTTTAMGQVKARYLKPDTYEVPGRKVTARGPKCGAEGNQVSFYSIVTQEFSDLAKKAEQEHIDDYRQAFDLTLKKWADIINSVAGKTFGPSTKKGVESLIRKELKKKGNKTRNQWVKKLDRLTGMSWMRDVSGWHKLNPDGHPVQVAPDCSKVVGHTARNPLTRIPGPLSKDFIR